MLTKFGQRKREHCYCGKSCVGPLCELGPVSGLRGTSLSSIAEREAFLIRWFLT